MAEAITAETMVVEITIEETIIETTVAEIMAAVETITEDKVNCLHQAKYLLSEAN